MRTRAATRGVVEIRRAPAPPASPMRPLLLPRFLSESELAPDDLLHDLVRAAADRAEARVAEGAFDLVLAHVAVAAEELQDVVGGAHAVALGDELRHRRLAQGVVPGDEQAQGVVSDGAAGLEPHRDLGDLVAGDLELAELAAERAALVHVGDGALEQV